MWGYRVPFWFLRNRLTRRFASSGVFFLAEFGENRVSLSTTSSALMPVTFAPLA